MNAVLSQVARDLRVSIWSASYPLRRDAEGVGQAGVVHRTQRQQPRCDQCVLGGPPPVCRYWRARRNGSERAAETGYARKASQAARPTGAATCVPVIDSRKKPSWDGLSPPFDRPCPCPLTAIPVSIGAWPPTRPKQ